jgi:hypothetical protein
MRQKTQLRLTRIAFSLEEVAGITCLNRRWLMMDCEVGKLKFLELDGRTLIPTGELVRYVADLTRDERESEDHQMALFDMSEEKFGA